MGTVLGEMIVRGSFSDGISAPLLVAARNAEAFGGRLASAGALAGRALDGLATKAAQPRDALGRFARVAQEAGSALDGMSTKAGSARDAMGRFAKGSQDAAATVAGFKRTSETAFDRLNRDLNTASDRAEKLHRSMRGLSAVSGAVGGVGTRLTAGVTAPAVLGIGLSIREAIAFEKAMVGVKKTTDATAPQLAVLGKEFTKLSESIGVVGGATALAGLGEVGGQLGVLTENLDEFARTAAELELSTPLNAEEAATQLAQFANIVGVSQKEFDNLGSALVELGNNGASSEKQILDTALRLAGAGRQIGLTAGEILGVANALASAGQRAEGGGGSFSRLFSQLGNAVASGGKELEKFARVANMTAPAFQALFKRDASAGLAAFLEGFKRMQVEGKNTLGVLDSLDIKETELRGSLTAVALANESVRASMERGNTAYAANAALAKEAAAANQSTAAELQMTLNVVQNVAREFGTALLPAVREAAGVIRSTAPLVRGLGEGFAALPGPIQLTGAAIAGIVIVGGPTLIFISKLTESIIALRAAALALQGAQGLAGVKAAVAGGGWLGSLAVGATIGAGAIYLVEQRAENAALALRDVAEARKAAFGGMDDARLQREAARFEAKRVELAGELAQKTAAVNRLEKQGVTAGGQGGAALRRLIQQRDELKSQVDTFQGLARAAQAELYKRPGYMQRNSIAGLTIEAPKVEGAGTNPLAGLDVDASKSASLLRSVNAELREMEVLASFGARDRGDLPEFARDAAERVLGLSESVADLRANVAELGSAAPASALRLLGIREGELERATRELREFAEEFDRFGRRGRGAFEVAVSQAAQIQGPDLSSLRLAGAELSANALGRRVPELAQLRTAAGEYERARADLQLAIRSGDKDARQALEERVRNLRDAVQKLGKAAAAAALGNPKLSAIQQKQVAEIIATLDVDTQPLAQSMQVAQQGIADLTAAMGDLGDQARRAISGVVSIVTGVQQMQAASQLTGLAQVAGAIGGLGALVGGVASLFGGGGASPLEQELARTRAELGRLRVEFSGFRATFAVRSTAGDAAAAARAAVDAIGFNGTRGGVLGSLSERQNAALAAFQAAGISLEQLDYIGDQVGVDIVQNGKVVVALLDEFAAATRLSALNVEKFSAVLENRASLLDLRRNVADIEDPGAALADEYRLLLEGLSERAEIDFGLVGLDLTTRAGRQALDDALLALVDSVLAGTLDASALEGFETIDEFLRHLRSSDDALDAFADTANRASESLVNAVEGFKRQAYAFDATSTAAQVTPTGRPRSADPVRRDVPTQAPAAAVTYSGPINVTVPIPDGPDGDAIFDAWLSALHRKARSHPSMRRVAVDFPERAS